MLSYLKFIENFFFPLQNYGIKKKLASRKEKNMKAEQYEYTQKRLK